MSFNALIILYFLMTNFGIYLLGIFETRRVNMYAKVHGKLPMPTYITITSTAPFAYTARITLTLGRIATQVFKLKFSQKTNTIFMHLTMFILLITTGMFQFAFGLMRHLGWLVKRI